MSTIANNYHLALPFNTQKNYKGRYSEVHASISVMELLLK